MTNVENICGVCLLTKEELYINVNVTPSSQQIHPGVYMEIGITEIFNLIQEGLYWKNIYSWSLQSHYYS